MGGRTPYRADIDGLRALAIIPVVAFHVGLPGFSGGFVGVDVFFVISGFLITGLLLKEQEQDGRIALMDFYARRVRRLLPALSLMMLATLAAGFVWLPPTGDQQRLAGSAIAASGFLSNVFFWRQQGGYFSPQAEVQPLLHTWTLAVEEQFYLAWPLAMVLIARAARRLRWPLRRALAATLVSGLIVSFAFYAAASRLAPGAAFYLTPFRAWELGIGALLALAPRSVRGLEPKWAGMLSAAGVAAVLAAVIGLTGLNLTLLAPTLGAGAVLVAGAFSPDNAVSRILAATPLRLIGKVSYGWYLWHWPLLAIARVQSLGARELPRDLGLAVLALVLAILTYRLVELPVRQRRVFPFKTVQGSIVAGAGLMALCIAAAAGLALAAHQASGPGGLARAAMDARARHFGALERCHRRPEASFSLPPAEDCMIGAPAAPASILLWGDSIAEQMIPPLDVAGNRLDVSVVTRTASGCRPFRNAPGHSFKEKDCVRFNHAIKDELDTLKRDHGLKGVILGGLWGDMSPDETTALSEFVGDLHRRGLKVVIVAQGPRGPKLDPGCLVIRSIEACAVGRAEAESSRGAQLLALRGIARTIPGVEVLDPFDVVCGPTLCPAMIDGVVAYRDERHLSHAGSLRLVEPLQRELAWAARP